RRADVGGADVAGRGEARCAGAAAFRQETNAVIAGSNTTRVVRGTWRQPSRTGCARSSIGREEANSSAHSETKKRQTSRRGHKTKLRARLSSGFLIRF